jgi:hypothetical protein
LLSRHLLTERTKSTFFSWIGFRFRFRDFFELFGCLRICDWLCVDFPFEIIIRRRQNQRKEEEEEEETIMDSGACFVAASQCSKHFVGLSENFHCGKY